VSRWGGFPLKQGENLENRSSDSVLLHIARVLVFAILVLFALSWLIAPDLIATGRNRLAALVNVRPERPSMLFSVSVPTSEVPHAASPFRPIASSTIDRSVVD
jgi:hypothetical protein